MFVFLRKRR